LKESYPYIVAEPLYIALALAGHSDAYYMMRTLVLRARERRVTLMELIEADGEARKHWETLPEEHKAIIRDPALYVGEAAARTELVCDDAELRISTALLLSPLMRPNIREAA